MNVHMFPQRGDEWRSYRCGRVTASRIADLMATTRSGPAASRKNYLAELVAERLTGFAVEGYSNAAMQWGTDQEPTARAAYEFVSDVDVTEVGFIDHPHIKMAGCSPDGLVGEDGMVEIKCPNTATHIDTLLRGEVEGKYLKQVQFQLACTGRAWCDFVSFDPRLPAEMQLWVRRIPRDDSAIDEIEDAVAAFLKELAETATTLRNRYQSTDKDHA